MYAQGQDNTKVILKMERVEWVIQSGMSQSSRNVCIEPFG